MSMYVVVDDEKPHESPRPQEIEIYDASYYETKLVQAVERTLPFDWN
jgi:hypothetical protein